MRDGNLQRRVEALVSGESSPSAFVQELSILCKETPDSAWDALSLIDQYHRRGKVSADVFRLVRYKIERHALGVQGADTIPELSPAPPTIAAAPALSEPHSNELMSEVRALRTELAKIRRELDVSCSQAMVYRERIWSYEWRRSQVECTEGEPGATSDSHARPRRVQLRPFPALALIALILGVGTAPMQQGPPQSVAPKTLSLPVVEVATSHVAEPVPDPGQISLSSDRYIVFPGDTSAEIEVRRTGDIGADISFKWWLEGSGAKPGKDYISHSPQILRMQAGTDSVTVSVPILANPLRKHTEMFDVLIGKPDGVILGSIRRAPVFIMRAD